MNGKKILYLFLALLFPGCIFVFLKYFGKNEFAVAPLYENSVPSVVDGCVPVTAPYQIPDSVFSQVNSKSAAVTMIIFGEPSGEGSKQMKRVYESFSNDSIEEFVLPESHQKNKIWKECIFFLKEPFNLILVDNERRIRGEYNLDDREDVDRLLTEITIILKKY